MNDWIKKFCENIIGKVKNEPYKFGFWACVLSFLIPIFIWLSYLIGSNGWGIPTDFTAGDSLLFYGSILTFLGAVSVQAVALIQTRRIRNEIIQKEKREENQKDEVWKRSVIAELKKLIICKETINKDIIDKRFPFKINALKNNSFTDIGYALKIFKDKSDNYLYLINGLKNLEADIKNYATLANNNINTILQIIINQKTQGMNIENLKDKVLGNEHKMQEIYENIKEGFSNHFNAKSITQILDYIDDEFKYH